MDKTKENYYIQVDSVTLRLHKLYRGKKKGYYTKMLSILTLTQKASILSSFSNFFFYLFPLFSPAVPNNIFHCIGLFQK